MKLKRQLLIVLLLVHYIVQGQSLIKIYPDSIQSDITHTYSSGVFYVVKTQEAHNTFLANGAHYNSIRVRILESVLNNANDITSALALLAQNSDDLQQLANKTDRVVFVIEKMPPWLSSSSDSSPAQTPGWSILNTKPPASYLAWNETIGVIVDRIWHTYAIENAYFEIWNEPDIGSWTGTQQAYFILFQNTYDAIKSIDGAIPVGGPATNHWANNITHIAPFGYVDQNEGNLSLIANLIDSTILWNKPLDFISWHNFNATIATHQNAIDFINYKYEELPIPELFISEWNAPSAIRDSDLHPAFAVKNIMAIKQLPIAADMIAAWQDFSDNPQEFYGGYGLMTYDGIRKPFFNAVDLTTQLKGNLVKQTTDTPISVESSIWGDSLFVLVANYAPPPIVEALNHTLFNGEFTIFDLDDAGYIDIASEDISYLNNIYRGEVSIPNTTPLNQAINAAIPLYSYYHNIQGEEQEVEISLEGYTGDYEGQLLLIDSITNNTHYVYDSLIINGYSHENAVEMVKENQGVVVENIGVSSGTLTLHMRPNSVALLKIVIPEILNLDSPIAKNDQISIYPNPAKNTITIQSNKDTIGIVRLLDANGICVKTYQLDTLQVEINVSNFARGMYVVQLENGVSIPIVLQ